MVTPREPSRRSSGFRAAREWALAAEDYIAALMDRLREQKAESYTVECVLRVNAARLRLDAARALARSAGISAASEPPSDARRLLAERAQ